MEVIFDHSNTLAESNDVVMPGNEVKTLVIHLAGEEILMHKCWGWKLHQ